MNTAFLNVQARNSKTPHFHIGSNVLVTHMLGGPHHNYWQNEMLQSQDSYAVNSLTFL